MEYFVLGCRCALGLVFATAAVSKLRSRAAFRDFAGSVRRLDLVRDRWAGPIAAAVVAAEVAVLGLLAVPGAELAGLVAAAALLTTFAAIIQVTLRRGQRVRCRCFGAHAAPLGIAHVLRNTVLAALAVLGAAAAAPSTQAGQHLAGVGVALGAGAVVAVLVIRLDDVLDLIGVNPVTVRKDRP